MDNYTDHHFRQLLLVNNISSFDALWSIQTKLVERGNERRGGWSHAVRLELADESGELHCFYMKRQFNHNSRSLHAPFGEPTFAREYRNIKRYESLAIGSLDVVSYQCQRIDGQDAAILITKALDSFIPLSDVWEDWQIEGYLSDHRKLQLIEAVATAIGELHYKRLSHYCLYPRHMYIRPRKSGYEVRFIDLEKARYQILRCRESIADLDAFLRRSQVLNDKELSHLLDCYLRSSELPITPQRLMSKLMERAESKRKPN